MNEVFVKKVPSKRESSFERLLRDTLRAGAPAVPDTGHLDGCLDAETLAAWAEETLSSRDRSAAEAHAADCARCQAMLAAMARTTPAAVEAPWWRVHMMAWMVPMSAAAAALLLWIALPMMRASYAPGESVGRVAEALPAPPVDATVVPEKEGAAREQKSDASRDERSTTAGGRALRQREEFARADAKDRKPANSALAKTEALPVRPDGNMASETRAKALADGLPTGSAPAEPAAPGVAAGVAGTAAPPSQPPPGSSPAPAAPAAPPSATPAPSPVQAAPQAPASTQERAAMESAREAAQAPQRAADRILARQVAGGPAPTTVLSPDPRSRWRLLSGGAVQRSLDGGATWQTQQTGVTTTFTAGASPSTLVCWIVGPRGTVQLSTDGLTWKPVPVPEAIDLVSIRATDDKNAGVTAADGRSFVTADGGATWRRR